MLQVRCGQCGFHHDDYDQSDTITSQWIVPAVLASSTEGLSADVLTQPDGAGTSIADRLAVVEARAVATLARICDAAQVATPAIETSAYEAIRDVLAGLDDAQWDRPAGGEGETIGFMAREGLHHGLHALAEIGRQRVALNAGAVRNRGTVHQINVSHGGVPKRPVASVQVTPRGVDGDAQNDRRHHGRPVQSVCLWSQDVIAGLAAEGHPIAAGSAGENITVAGIDWASLMPGSRIDIGSVAMLITAHAIPCAKNAQWFSDRDFGRILHDRNPGLSRLYALPLGSGTVSVGDAVVVEPG